jgi:hypothetical protein
MIIVKAAKIGMYSEMACYSLNYGWVGIKIQYYFTTVYHTASYITVYVTYQSGGMNVFREILHCISHSVGIVRERTIPTERPPLDEEVSAIFYG